MLPYSEFKKHIQKFYKQNRRSFPWRETSNPYEILVSEVMLQQTQTHRVVPKYLLWIQRFPTVHDLAKNELSEVLLAWSGLGYNRRAKFLWETAKVIDNTYNGKVPSSFEELVTLPGIGEYTANALRAFAYNQPTIVLETNIRTAIIHHFFSDSDKKISDAQIKDVLTKVLDQKDPRNWYYALMDYGNWLKTEGIKNFHQQKAHVKQKPFKGSERFVRGYLVRESLKQTTLNLTSLIIPGYTNKQIKKVATDLVKEGLLKEDTNGMYSIN